jgi:hypothetical protein
VVLLVVSQICSVPPFQNSTTLLLLAFTRPSCALNLKNGEKMKKNEAILAK